MHCVLQEKVVSSGSRADAAEGGDGPLHDSLSPELECQLDARVGEIAEVDDWIPRGFLDAPQLGETFAPDDRCLPTGAWLALVLRGCSRRSARGRLNGCECRVGGSGARGASDGVIHHMTPELVKTTSTRRFRLRPVSSSLGAMKQHLPFASIAITLGRSGTTSRMKFRTARARASASCWLMPSGPMLSVRPEMTIRSDSRARCRERRRVWRDSAVRVADPNGKVRRMCVSTDSARDVMAGADAARGDSARARKKKAPCVSHFTPLLALYQM